MSTRITPALVAALCLGATVAEAQEALGFAELRLGLFPGVSGAPWQLVERVRPTLSSKLGERVTLTATVEAGLAQGRNAEEEAAALLGMSAPSYQNPLLRISRSDDYLDVDRLYMDVYGERFDVRVGRQAVNWGSAQFFNPTDPFPEVLLAEPWRPRRGVNAARLNVALAESLDLSTVAGVDDAFGEFRGAARVRWNVAATDLAVVGAWRGLNRNALVGVDLRGTFGVGWWIEAAYLMGDSPHEALSVGIDYSFPVLERAVLFAQYYRNGAGAKDVTAATQLRVRAPAQERDPFAPFVLGRDYGLVGASLGILPELSASCSALQNLNDGSGSAIVASSYSVVDWLELAASAQLPYSLWGEGGELRPRREDLRFELPSGTLGETQSVDLSGLVPTATVTVWTRASF